MLPGIVGIKPWYLWGHTSRKHLRALIADMHKVMVHPQGRERKSMLMVYAIAMAIALGASYATGVISPERYLTTIVRQDGECTEKSKVPCPKTSKSYMPPCPCTEEDAVCKGDTKSKKK